MSTQLPTMRAWPARSVVTSAGTALLFPLSMQGIRMDRAIDATPRNLFPELAPACGAQPQGQSLALFLQMAPHHEPRSPTFRTRCRFRTENGHPSSSVPRVPLPGTVRGSRGSDRRTGIPRSGAGCPTLHRPHETAKSPCNAEPLRGTVADPVA